MTGFKIDQTKKRKESFYFFVLYIFTNFAIFSRFVKNFGDSMRFGVWSILKPS